MKVASLLYFYFLCQGRNSIRFRQKDSNHQIEYSSLQVLDWQLRFIGVFGVSNIHYCTGFNTSTKCCFICIRSDKYIMYCRWPIINIKCHWYALIFGWTFEYSGWNYKYWGFDELSLLISLLFFHAGAISIWIFPYWLFSSVLQ